MDDVYKILIVFDDMKIEIENLSNRKPNPIITELFIRGRKLNISLFLLQSLYFGVSKNTKQNSKHYFIKKIPNKQEL